MDHCNVSLCHMPEFSEVKFRGFGRCISNRLLLIKKALECTGLLCM